MYRVFVPSSSNPILPSDRTVDQPFPIYPLLPSSSQFHPSMMQCVRTLYLPPSKYGILENQTEKKKTSGKERKIKKRLHSTPLHSTPRHVILT